jgi:tetratricopeptide (TPR) repeat protein
MSTAMRAIAAALVVLFSSLCLPAAASSKTSHSPAHKAHAKKARVKSPRKKHKAKKAASKVKAKPGPAKAAVRKDPVPPPALKDQDYLGQGERLLDGYDGGNAEILPRAEGLFRGALEADPACARAYVGLSKAEMCRGYVPGGSFDDRRLTRAMTLVDMAVDLDTGCGAAHLQRGYLFLYMDSLRLASDEADRAAALGVPSSRLSGEVAMRLGQTARAKELWSRAVDESGGRDGEKADAYDALGELAMREDEPGKAADYFKKALALRPDSAWEAANYGIALARMGRTDDAVEVLTNVLRQQDFPEARTGLAFAYLKKGVSLHDRGELRMAESCYTKAIEYDPKLKAAYKDLAGIYEKAGEKDKVAELCRKALKYDPDDQWAGQTLSGLSGDGKP